MIDSLESKPRTRRPSVLFLFLIFTGCATRTSLSEPVPLSFESIEKLSFATTASEIKEKFGSPNREVHYESGRSALIYSSSQTHWDRLFFWFAPNGQLEGKVFVPEAQDSVVNLNGFYRYYPSAKTEKLPRLICGSHAMRDINKGVFVESHFGMFLRIEQETSEILSISWAKDRLETSRSLASTNTCPSEKPDPVVSSLE